MQEQRRRFADIENYPHELSVTLRELRDDLVRRMRADNSGWQEILKAADYANERR